MKAKIGTIVICMLLITVVLPLSATAGSEENPEIEDYNDGDVDDVFGTFARIPGLFNFFQLIGVFNIDSYDIADIQSAWYYEDANEPDYLYTALKLKDISLIRQTQIYTVRWTYNEEKYSTSVHAYVLNGEHIYFVGGSSTSKGTREEIEGSFDVENNIVYFAISKHLIGNPQPGDVLTETNAWAALRFSAEPLTVFFGGELMKDWSGYGREYTIQY